MNIINTPFFQYNTIASINIAKTSKISTCWCYLHGSAGQAQYLWVQDKARRVTMRSHQTETLHHFLKETRLKKRLSVANSFLLSCPRSPRPHTIHFIPSSSAPQILGIFHKPKNTNIRFYCDPSAQKKIHLLNPETSEMEEPMVRTGVVVNVRIPQKTKTACPRLLIFHYIFRHTTTFTYQK